MAGSKWIDIQTAAPCIAGIDTQLAGLTARPNIHKNALNALLVELIVVAKADDVLQQCLLVDRLTAVADLHRSPIGLSCD